MPYIERCYKVYDEFNELVYDSNNAYAKIPPAQSSYVIFEDRQALYNGYKQNVDIVDDKVMLDDVGKRVCFYDASEQEPIWRATNRNLPPKVNDYTITTGTTPYNCECLAATDDGTYYSSNSGGDWTQIRATRSLLVSGFLSSQWLIVEYSGANTYDITSVFLLGGTFSFTKQATITSTETPKVLHYNSNFMTLAFETKLNAIDTSGLWTTHESTYANGINGISFDGTYYYICAGDGVYRTTKSALIAGFSSTLLSGTGAKGETYCYLDFKDKTYIGTYNGLFVYDSGVLCGDTPSDNNYLVNIKRSKVSSLIKTAIVVGATTEDNFMYVGQDAGFSSTIDGIKFTTCVNGLSPDILVKKLILNPQDDRLVHALTNTTKNIVPYITFMIDSSSSMINSIKYEKEYGYGYSQYLDGADFFDVFLDIDGATGYGFSVYGINTFTSYGYCYGYEYYAVKNQYDLLAEIGEAINAQYLLDVDNSDIFTATIPGMRFQLITFATNPNKVLSAQANTDMVGATNITNGFTPWSSPGDPYRCYDFIYEINSNADYKTPLYEAMWVSLQGLYSDGNNWYYNTNTNKYKIDSYDDEPYRNSYKSVVVVTDGRDTASLKTISDITGSQSYSIQNIGIKFYIIVYGEQSNFDFCQKFRNDSMEILYCRAGNDSDFDRIKSYIITQESRRRRTGIYRKSYYSTDKKRFIDAVINTNIYTNTSIQVTYRISDDKYDLGDFKRAQTTLVNGNNTISINEFGKFIEFEFKMISDDINNSPCINSIKIDYNEPSESSIVLMPFDNVYDNVTIKRIDEIHFTQNLSFWQYDSLVGYDYFHFLDQATGAVPIEVHNRFSPTNSTHPEIFENMPMENRSIVDRRDNEKTKTTDYTTYTLVNGAWHPDQQITVYLNGTEIDDSKYLTRPENGQIVFLWKLLTSQIITATIEPMDIFRIAIDFKNIDNETYCAMKNAAFEYSIEEDTQDTREALPLTASQLATSSNAVTQVKSRITDNTSNLIAGSNGFINTTYYLKEPIEIYSHILFGYGEYIIIPTTEEVKFKPHENMFIFDSWQYDYMTNVNYFNISCDVDLAKFKIIGTTPNKMLLIRYDGPTTLQKGARIYFNIGGTLLTHGGFNTELNTTSDTQYTIPNGVAGALRTSICISSSPSTKTGTIEEIEAALIPNIIQATPEVNLSSLAESTYSHVVVQSTSASKTFPICIVKSDQNGVMSYGTKDSYTIQIHNLDDDTLTDVTNPILISGNGYVRSLVQVSKNGFYKIVATNKNGSKTSNAINVSGGQKILWGDLNAKSAFGEGRQSPEFIYDYAKNIAGLDFCAIADPIAMMTSTEWEQAQAIANDNNLQGEFCTLIGAQWNPTTIGDGYRTAIFGQGSIPSSTELQTPETIIEFFNLVGRYNNALSFAHNPAYSPTNDLSKKYNVNWQTLASTIDKTRELAVEIYSEQGTSEAYLPSIFGSNEPFLNHSSDAGTPSYVVDALEIGYKMAFLGNSNGFCSRPGFYAGELNLTNRPSSDTTSSVINNRGLTAVVTSEFSRDGIFHAIAKGHTYATTGAKIYIELSMNSSYTMGDTANVKEIRSGSKLVLDMTPTFTCKVIPTGNATADIQLVRVLVGGTSTNKVQVVHSFSSADLTSTFTDTGLISVRQSVCYYLRVVQSDKHRAYTSPIYISYQIFEL
jgi:hypothetical protein